MALMDEYRFYHFISGTFLLVLETFLLCNFLMIGEQKSYAFIFIGLGFI